MKYFQSLKKLTLLVYILPISRKHHVVRNWKWDKEVARTWENNISSQGMRFEDAGQEVLPCPLLCLVFDVNVLFLSCSGLPGLAEP